jgi:hypothetical protein
MSSRAASQGFFLSLCVLGLFHGYGMALLCYDEGGIADEEKMDGIWYLLCW